MMRYIFVDLPKDLLLTFRQTLETIRAYFGADEPYIADPHTAVGLVASHKIENRK